MLELMSAVLIEKGGLGGRWRGLQYEPGGWLSDHSRAAREGGQAHCSLLGVAKGGVGGVPVLGIVVVVNGSLLNCIGY